MKIYSYICIAMLFIGCSSKYVEPELTSKRITIVKEQVPVKCQIPKVECEFSGSGFIPTHKLLQCIQLQKKALDLCADFK